MSTSNRAISDGQKAADAGGASWPAGTFLVPQDARARAFAFFINGASLGYLAMAYDSAAIVTPSVPSDVVPDLAFYPDVATAGLALMDSAIAITTSANASSGANGFPLPSTRFNGLALTQAQFVQFIRAHQARIRAGIARTPTERAAVNWTQVIADADPHRACNASVGFLGASLGVILRRQRCEGASVVGEVTQLVEVGLFRFRSARQLQQRLSPPELQVEHRAILREGGSPSGGSAEI